MDIKDAAHIAKLAHFGVQMTAAIDKEAAHHPVIANLVRTIACRNAVKPPVSLLNQSAFLGQLYVTFLWAREAVGENDARRFNDALGAWFDHKDDSRVVVRACRERNLTDIDVFTRTMRNALGHARVELSEEADGQLYFDFSDKDRTGNSYATIRMPWFAVGELTEAATLAISFIAYGSPQPPTRTPLEQPKDQNP